MCLYLFDLLLYSVILISFILPHLPYAAKFREVYANMWNCYASEILRLCGRSCWGRYMFTRSRRRSWVCSNARCIFSRKRISPFFFFCRSICISIRHRFTLTWILKKLLSYSSSSSREKHDMRADRSQYQDSNKWHL